MDHLDKQELKTNISSLNKKQKEIFDTDLNKLANQDKHINKTYTCNDNNPLRIFCSGVGGS